MKKQKYSREYLQHLFDNHETVTNVCKKLDISRAAFYNYLKRHKMTIVYNAIVEQENGSYYQDIKE